MRLYPSSFLLPWIIVAALLSPPHAHAAFLSKAARVWLLKPKAVHILPVLNMPSRGFPVRSQVLPRLPLPNPGLASWISGWISLLPFLAPFPHTEFVFLVSSVWKVISSDIVCWLSSFRSLLESHVTPLVRPFLSILCKTEVNFTYTVFVVLHNNRVRQQSYYIITCLFSDFLVFFPPSVLYP